jgi:DNA-binding NarL/FixJ family response regulator
MPLDLTRRQRAVLEAYVKHGTYRGAAEELGITITAAETRMGYLLQKNGWHSVAQAAYYLGIDEASTKTTDYGESDPLRLAM